MSSGIYLLLGTNLGDRLNNLKQAKNQIISNAGKIILESAIYETAPWGGLADQPPYLNQVVRIESNNTPDQLLSILLEIETRMGRRRRQKWEPRIVDIDILLFDQEVIESKNLIIPHPRLHERKFTLIPLAEIAPDFIQPVFQKSIKTLLLECEDTLEVSAFIEN